MSSATRAILAHEDETSRSANRVPLSRLALSGREEFSLGTAAGDLASAASDAAIPIEAVGIGLVALLGLVYLISTLLFA